MCVFSVLQNQLGLSLYVHTESFLANANTLALTVSRGKERVSQKALSREILHLLCCDVDR